MEFGLISWVAKNDFNKKRPEGSTIDAITFGPISAADLALAEQMTRIIEFRIEELEALSNRTPDQAEQLDRLRDLLSPIERPNIVKLERGHVPQSAENIRGIPALTTYAIVLGVDGLSYIAGVHSALTPVEIGGVLLAYALAGQLGKRFDKFKDSHRFNRLFPIHYGLITGRDKTMTKNLVDAMTRPEIGQILVIVGRMHVPGIKRRLLSDGFTEAPL